MLVVLVATRHVRLWRPAFSQAKHGHPGALLLLLLPLFVVTWW